MNSVETKIERQVQLWALTGPMIALLTSSLILFKAPSHATYLMIALIIGLPACWWAKWRGLAMSFGILAALFVFNYTGIPAGQKLWHFGMVISLLICFAVTSLSLEEAQSMMEGPETNQDQENKLMAMQKVHEEQLVELNEYKELLESVRQEVQGSQKENEALKLDLVQRAQNLAKYEEQNAEIARRYKEQQELFEKARQEMQYFQSRLQSLNGELQTAKVEMATARRQNEELVQELAKAKEVSEVYAKAHEEQMVRESVAHEMADHFETLSKEKELLQSALNKIQLELSESRGMQHQTEMELKNLQSTTDILQIEKEQVQQELAVLAREKEVLQNECKEAHNKSKQMQLEIQKLQSEKTIQQENVNKLQSESREWQNKSASTQHELHRLVAEKTTLQDTLTKLQSDLKEMQARAAQSQQEWQQQLKDKETMQQHLSSLQSELDQLREQHKQRAMDYADLNAQLANLQNKADMLSVEKEHSLQELQALRAERDALAKETQENGYTFEGVSSQSSAWRQAEAKYTQLQGQFAEKSAVLDNTRRELFLTQEKLLQLQKEIEEAQNYNINEAEAALTQQLIQLDKQSKCEVADYQKEVAALHEIITTLMRNK